MTQYINIDTVIWLLVIGVYIIVYFSYRMSKLMLQMSIIMGNMNENVNRVDRRTERMEIKLAEKDR